MCCANSPGSAAPPETHRQGGSAAALAVFDLDGTVSRADTLVPFLASCVERHPWRLARMLGALPAVVRFVFDRDLGALKGSFLHATLGGLPRADLQHAAERFVRRLVRHGLHREALEAIQAHRDRGDWLVLMSASTDLYVPYIGATLNFNEVICTRLHWDADGRLDGRLASANCRGAEKQRQLATLIERLRPARVYAYGNTDTDLLHMQLAQEAYLVNSSAAVRPELASIVRRVHWQ